MKRDDPAAPPEPVPDSSAPLIRVVGADRATLGLLQEWLTASGYRVISAGGAYEPVRGEAVLTIVDVPFTRHGAIELLRRVTNQAPGTPILVLSPTFFSNVKCDGPCARELGVAGVLPKPIDPEALIAAVEGLLQPTP